MNGADGTDREQCLHSYRTNDSDVVEDLTSKHLYRLLDKTREYRNDWKGHPGAESDDLASERVTLLEAELLRHCWKQSF